LILFYADLMTTTSTEVTPLPDGYRTTFGKITRILAMLTGTLVVIQFALAGYGAFGSFSHQRDFGPHETLGNIIAGFTLLILIAVLVARPGMRRIWSSVALLVLAGPVQPLLADAAKHHAWVGLFHAFAGILILGLCFDLSRKYSR
jgi:hypothetical protein